MKVWLVLIIVLSAFICEANAQLCGNYTTTLFIKNEAGEPIKNANVKIVALQRKDRTKGNGFARDKDDASKFSMTFSEGYQVEGKYKVTVSAEGYSVIEREIEFPHCERQKIDFTLAKDDSIVLIGTVSDWNSKGIKKVFIKAIGDGGQEFTTVSDNKGQYRFVLPPGKYNIEFKKNKFNKLICQDVTVKKSSDGKMNLDVSLGKAEKPTILN